MLSVEGRPNQAVPVLASTTDGSNWLALYSRPSYTPREVTGDGSVVLKINDFVT